MELKDVPIDEWTLFKRKCPNVRKVFNEMVSQVKHWKANHDDKVQRLRKYTCRPDMTINKLETKIVKLQARVGHEDSCTKWNIKAGFYQFNPDSKCSCGLQEILDMN